MTLIEWMGEGEPNYKIINEFFDWFGELGEMIPIEEEE